MFFPPVGILSSVMVAGLGVVGLFAVYHMFPHFLEMLQAVIKVVFRILVLFLSFFATLFTFEIDIVKLEYAFT